MADAGQAPWWLSWVRPPRRVEARWDAFVRSGGTEGALSAAELDAILAAPETAKEDVGQRLAILQRLLGFDDRVARGGRDAGAG